MQLLLKRIKRTDKSTIGQLSVNGDVVCYTLEDVDRRLKKEMPLSQIKKTKIKGKTAIPSGVYQVVITYSGKFQKYLPLLLNVPGFEGIRIHSGNEAANTEGCLLTGSSYSEDWINDSRKAFNKLFPLLTKAEKKEKIFITIE